MQRRSFKVIRGRTQRGSAIIELALTFVGFLLLSIGAMEFGMAVYTWNTCVSSAQDAARWASVRGSLSSPAATADDVTAEVKTLATALDPSKLTVSTSWIPNNSPGSLVQVTVNYSFTPMAYLALKQSLSLSSTAQVVVNH